MKLQLILASCALTFAVQAPAFSLKGGERDAIVSAAFKHRGKPYRSETNGPITFDCSGFIHYVMREVLGPARFTLPYNMAGTGYRHQSVFYRDHLKQRKAQINCKKAKRADIVFFPSIPGTPNHIGFITSTKPLIFFTAQSRATGVKPASFENGSYWSKRKPECYSNIWVN